ncbi:hypothetical protein GCM10020295_37300 [Streptomyces cinereospinus]
MSRRWLGRWRTAEKRTGERDLHRWLRRELQGLGVKPPLDVEELCRALGERRGRPILLRPFPLEKPGPSGLWVDTPQMDVILYQQETTRLHQEHIILHEVGHILVSEDEQADEEQETPDDFVEGWATLIPVLDPDLVRRVAQRCSYDDGEECEVELAATIILEWSSALDPATPLSDDPTLRRIQSALGDRRGWL